jgi:hypothetical protein
MIDSCRQMIFALASRFRSAIVTSVPSTSSLATLRDFPHGACGDASLLLAKYLQVSGLGRSAFVVGHRDGQEHAWLQLHDFTVDITADQYKDQDAAVIVADDSSWHSSFNGNIHNIADFCLYDRDSAVRLSTAYQEITRCLERYGHQGAPADPADTVSAVGCHPEKW